LPQNNIFHVNGHYQGYQGHRVSPVKGQGHVATAMEILWTW